MFDKTFFLKYNFIILTLKFILDIKRSKTKIRQCISGFSETFWFKTMLSLTDSSMNEPAPERQKRLVFFMKKIELMKFKQMMAGVIIAGTIVFSPLYLTDAHALFESGITPEISNSIKMSKSASGDTQKQILLKSVDRAKTVQDILALADASKSNENRKQILLKGVKLAKTAKDFTQLADKAKDTIVSDQIVLVGAKSVKTPEDFKTLIKKAYYAGTKDAIAKTSSGIKTDYVVPGSNCSPKIQAIFNGSYSDGLLEASLKNAKNVHDVIALGHHCVYFPSKDYILMAGRNLAVSVDDCIMLAGFATSFTTRDIILSCGVSKAKTLQDFNKLAAASTQADDTISALGKMFAAAAGKGGALEKAYNDMMATHKKYYETIASGLKLSDKEKKRLYQDFCDKYNVCEKMISNYQVSVDSNSKPPAASIVSSSSNVAADVASKKKAYEDMTNAYNAYKEAVGSDDPNADKLLSDYTKKLDAYSKMK